MLYNGNCEPQQISFLLCCCRLWVCCNGLSGRLRLYEGLSNLRMIRLISLPCDCYKYSLTEARNGFFGGDGKK